MQLTIENTIPTEPASVAVVLIPGTTLDASNARDFKTAVAPLITSGGRIVFDLSNLKFVDSSGLGALLSSLRQVGTAGGQLKLCGLNKPVRALMELVRMHRVFEIFNTRAEALRSFAE